LRGTLLFINFGETPLILLVAFHKTSLTHKNPKMLVWRGLTGGSAVLLYFFAIANIPLSAAATLANSYPLFATFFSLVLFKEKPQLATIIALLVAFFGTFIILDPDFSQIEIGHLAALLSAGLAGISITAIHELRKTDGSWAIVLAFLLGCLLCSIPFSVTNFHLPNLYEWGLLLLIGILTTIGQGYFTRGFKHVSVSEGSTLALADTAFTIFFSVLLLGEVLTSRFIIGAFLVFGGSIYLIAAKPTPAQQKL
jgi:drug/metabolite transporter (DMT)-like permease